MSGQYREGAGVFFRFIALVAMLIGATTIVSSNRDANIWNTMDNLKKTIAHTQAC